MKKLLTAILILLTITGNAVTRYVSTTGTNSGAGGIGAPWLTLVYAMANSSSGDIIHVNAGTFLETSQLNLPVGVSIEGEGVTSIIQSTLTADFNAIIYVGSAEGTSGNQHISNVKFDGRSLATDWGIQVYGRSNVEVYNCTIENFRDRGVIFAGRTDGALLPPTIYATGNKFYNNIINNSGQYNGYGRGNLNIGGQNGMLIYGNTITQNQRAVGSNGWCIKGFNDGFLRNVKIYNNTLTRIPHSAGDDFDFAIELFFLEGGNEVYNNTIQGSFDTNFQSVGAESYSLWIHDNTFSVPTHASAVQHGIILEFDSDGVIIEDNTFTNITKCVSFFPRVNMVQNITIRNNLFKNIGGFSSGHFIGGFESETGDFDVSNFYIYNNTFIADPSSAPDWGINFGGVNATHGYNNLQIKNNIFENTSIAWFVSGSLEKITNSAIQYNNAYGNGNSNDPNPSFIGSAPLAGSSVISNTLKVDPLYANTSSYPLSSSSPLRDAGVNVGLAYMGAAPDISYVEFNVSGNVAPSANAGSNQTITLPTSSVSLTGSGTDTDGAITAYLWTKTSGTGGTITTPTTQNTTVTGLTEGVYIFRLTVTDDSASNNTGYDEVQITVNGAGSSPSANAGTDISITLPTASASLTGSGTGTTASANNIILQSETLDNATWGKSNVNITANQAVDVLGNNTLDLVTITTSTNNYLFQTFTVVPGTTYYCKWDVKRGTATNMHYGFFNENASNYIGGSTTSYYSSTSTTVSTFSTSFTAPTGCTSVSIEISSETPTTGTFYAGRVHVSTQSAAVYGTTTTAALNGAAGSTITGYAWTKISGTGGTITTPSAQNTTVTGLTAGVYVYRLTVTDNLSATAFDEVQVTVNAGGDVTPPTVNSTSPTNAATGVAIAVHPTITFNENILSGTVTTSSAYITGVTSTVGLSGAVVTITPTSNLAYSTTYTINATTTITDLSGNALASNYTSTFTTVAAPNVPPTANAGNDTTIVLPTSSLTITGTGTDTDGTIPTKVWTQTSGTSATISNGTTYSPTFSGMTTEGVRVFRLTVTDNVGATGYDERTVTVSAQPTISTRRRFKFRRRR
jgi:Bacterial Ig-like domain